MLADAVASIGVIVGVVATVMTGWLRLDSLVAAGVGVYILASGWHLVKDSVSGLMDEAADAATLTTIQACIAKEAQGAIEAHDLQTRHAGPVTFIQFDLVVPASMTVAEAHGICDRIEDGLRQTLHGGACRDPCRAGEQGERCGHFDETERKRPHLEHRTLIRDRRHCDRSEAVQG